MSDYYDENERIAELEVERAEARELGRRRAAFLAEAIALGVHVLDSQDEDDVAEFAPVNALVVFDNVWVAGASKRRDGVLVLGCRRRAV